MLGYTEKDLLNLINGAEYLDRFFETGRGGLFPNNNNGQIKEISLREAFTKLIQSRFPQEWRNCEYRKDEWVTYNNKIYKAKYDIVRKDVFDAEDWVLFYENTQLVSDVNQKYRYGYFKVVDRNYDISQPPPIGLRDGLYIIGSTAIPDEIYNMGDNIVYEGTILIANNGFYNKLYPEHGDVCYLLSEDAMLFYSRDGSWNKKWNSEVYEFIGGLETTTDLDGNETYLINHNIGSINVTVVVLDRDNEEVKIERTRRLNNNLVSIGFNPSLNTGYVYRVIIN